jgi:dienelactone hydrolase
VVREMKGLLKRWALALLIPGVFLAALAAVWLSPPTRLALDTLLLYPQLLAPPPRAVASLLGPEPTVERARVPLAGGASIAADVYRPPGEGRRSAILVVIGAAPTAHEDPRAVRMARAVARMGHVVMLPVLPHLGRKVLTSEDIEAVVASFQHLQAQPYVDRERIAVLGFSVGQGLAFAAAADPRIRDDVRALVSFGGYYDVREVITAVLTGTIDTGEGRQPWQPDPWAREVLRTSLLHFVPEREERELMSLAVGSGVEVPLDGLSRTGSLIYRALTSREPAEIQGLIAQVPPEVAAVLDALSPMNHLDGIKAEVFIAADRYDPLIPYTESRRLRDDLRARGVTVHYAETGIFRHVDPALEANPVSFLSDFVRLFLNSYLLFQRLT